jgi:hypothetical protein
MHNDKARSATTAGPRAWAVPDRLGLPCAEAVSGAATQAPSAVFQMLWKAVFMLLPQMLLTFECGTACQTTNHEPSLAAIGKRKFLIREIDAVQRLTNRGKSRYGSFQQSGSCQHYASLNCSNPSSLMHCLASKCASFCVATAPCRRDGYNYFHINLQVLMAGIHTALRQSRCWWARRLVMYRRAATTCHGLAARAWPVRRLQIDTASLCPPYSRTRAFDDPGRRGIGTGRRHRFWRISIWPCVQITKG